MQAGQASAGERSGRTPQEQERLRREIESTDGEIDRLVYELYGLTEEEIRIVEEWICPPVLRTSPHFKNRNGGKGA